MINVVTTPLPHRDPLTVDSLAQSEMFKYINGNAIYMKGERGSIIHLKTGEMFPIPSNGIVERITEVTIRTERMPA